MCCSVLSVVALQGCVHSGPWRTTEEPEEDPTSAPAACGPQSFQLASERPRVLLLLDRSSSMLDPPEASETLEVSTKWELIVPAITEVVQRTDATVDWGMKSFPEGDLAGECAPNSVTERIDVPIDDMNAGQVIERIGEVQALGDGTPTGDAVRSALDYLRSLPDQAPKFLILATDGEPSCAGETKGQEAARPYAIEALTEAHASGVPTFVVGVATNKESATHVLNALAVAGGQARAESESDPTRYYLGNTRDELVRALLEITDNLGQSCQILLPSSPTSPELVQVRIAGEEVPRDLTRKEGWDWVAQGRVQTYGAACEATRKAAPGKLEIVYGCGQAAP